MPLNVAVLAPATTVTGPETGSRALLLDTATDVPPVGADLESVIVQVVATPEFRLVGLHVSEDTSTGATRFTVAVLDCPPRVAVTVAV